ncbi:MAG TPA: hypothetical protein VMS17_19120 [Gemmataceae bacterium]|nr:hypothetical protein [Gemmataceae bacterium]
MSIAALPGALASRLALWNALRWLVRDTFWQAVRSGASWLMLAGSIACIVGCLVVPLGGPADANAVEQQLAVWVVQGAALLVALTATAGMLPAFLAPHAASVLLSKPAPRLLLLTGKSIGVIAFVACHAFLLVGGTWLALAARTGYWDATYLVCAPLMVLHFTIFFGFSAMLASATRSTAAVAFGTVLFWLLCWAMNFGRHAAIGALGPHAVAPAFGGFIDAAYWLLPKPLDFQLALTDAAHGGSQTLGLGRVVARGAWAPGLSLLASALAGVGLLAAAAYDFGTAEY